MEVSLERAMRISGLNAQYDRHAKNLLSQKIVLAYILVNAVSEFAGLEPEDVIPLIEGDPEVSMIPVNPGETNSPEEEKSGALREIASAIDGCSTESGIPYEGRITYDVRFFVRVPGKEEKVKIIVDLEAQKNFYPGYDLVTRGVFYTSRMISAQLDTEFVIPHYNDIKKVYSIWICMNSPQKARNTITEFCMEKRNIVGNSGDLGRYDLLSVIMVGLPEKLTEEGRELKLHRLLGTLFSDRMPVDRKKEILSQEFGISMTLDWERSVNIMCNLSEAIEERGIEKGIKTGLEKGIESGVKALIETCMELDVSREDTLIRLVQKFSMTKENAERYLNQYWNKV
ncbi:MAG: hypothetical protein QM657_17595 [Lacrimispora sp.]|uniref:hypothetical protein n=1 Tax=Lacrimispora sp. TaxID=2719234 RepID=UPI0039E667E8